MKKFHDGAIAELENWDPRVREDDASAAVCPKIVVLAHAGT
ncbi:MAG TPA: hypothetical protein VFS02_16670 [Telluria sp.]|nr:hypothetical protein [Telluria sp.]